MDPITTTLVAALVAGAAAGSSEVAKRAIIDAYEGVKKMIANKTGANSDLIEAVSGLEGKHDSPARQAVVTEEVVAADLNADADIMAAIDQLQDALTRHGDERTQEVINSARVQQAMRGGSGKQTQKASNSSDVKQTME